MLSQSEKFQAIEQAFPHIPKQHKSRIAARISEIGNVFGIVRAYVRHSMTQYDTLLQGKQYYGSSWKESRQIASNDVSTILNSWK